jgi:hypothetical protein
MAETTRYLSEKINGQRRMSAFDPKRQLRNPALKPCARIATFLDFRWPFAQSQVALNEYFARIIDRARAINTTPDQDPNKAALKATLPHLKLRATLVNRAIYWAVASGKSP